MSETSQSDREDGSVVERIELAERHTDLRLRAESVGERIERVGGSDVPDELEPAYRRLSAVAEELKERDDLPASELDEVEEFIEEQAAQLDDLEVAEEISDLEERREELKSEIEELRTRRNELLGIVEGEFGDGWIGTDRR